MKLIHAAIRFPVSTAVGVLLLLLFGSIALVDIPIQLVPTVEQPQITVTTVWPGASPQEVEREIVDEQEEVLKGIENLRRLESISSDSSAVVTLTFRTGTDLDTALLRVSNRLQQVPSYPDDADRPVLGTVSNQSVPITWLVLRPAGSEPFTGDLSTLWDLADEVLKPEFERIAGVASAQIHGGRESEMQVLVDPAKLAARRVTASELVAALERENRNVTGGAFDEGKRSYLVRAVGELTTPAEVEDVVVAVRDGVPVWVRDVARVELGHKRWTSRVYHQGEARLGLSAQRASGANVLDTMRDLKSTMRRLNEDLLASRGLELVQTYDETEYLESSIRLVRQSLLLGGVLAALVLLLFLRSFTSTLVVVTAIPISVVGTFLMLWLLGRSLNVVSLAGMAFAVGMVVDNSIVVLENIYRHRQLGRPRTLAAFEGAREVWGAVLASTATTVAVFLPVIFIEEEVGQLFRDIAIAISCGVTLSLFVAITVIPSLSAVMLSASSASGSRHGFHTLWGGTALAGRLAELVVRAVDALGGGRWRRLAVVGLLTAAAVGGSLILAPKTEYLPQGNQNFIFGIVLPPPGLNVDELERIQDPYVDQLEHWWTTPAAEARDLPGGGIRDLFFVLAPDFTLIGAAANEPLRVRELLAPLQRLGAEVPGLIAFFQQSSLFQADLGRDRNVEINLTGPDLERLQELGRTVLSRAQEVMPDAQSRPVHELSLGNPELRLRLDRRRAADLGMSSRELGVLVRMLVDGFKASEVRWQGREIDLTVKADLDGRHQTHRLDQLPFAAPDGRLVTVGSVANVQLVSGPTQVFHSERERTVAVAVTPPLGTTLLEAMSTIESEILAPLMADGTLGGLYRARLAGTADKLIRTWRALRWNFVLAVVITYLLMAALFESFLHPLVILFSVPLAAFGGVLGLTVLNLFLPSDQIQALDVLTMLGFFILVGTVVNNAILIVHQTLRHRRDGAEIRPAIRDAVEHRIRPIFMSVSTSVCGMLPLVLFPGAGSELYRGLGSVVVGGLLVSTLFTLILVPSLLGLVLEGWEGMARRLGRRPSA